MEDAGLEVCCHLKVETIIPLASKRRENRCNVVGMSSRRHFWAHCGGTTRGVGAAEAAALRPRQMPLCFLAGICSFSGECHSWDNGVRGVWSSHSYCRYLQEVQNLDARRCKYHLGGGAGLQGVLALIYSFWTVSSCTKPIVFPPCN